MRLPNAGEGREGPTKTKWGNTWTLTEAKRQRPGQSLGLNEEEGAEPTSQVQTTRGVANRNNQWKTGAKNATLFHLFDPVCFPSDLDTDVNHLGLCCNFIPGILNIF